jgi:hypothetical protein
LPSRRLLSSSLLIASHQRRNEKPRPQGFAPSAAASTVPKCYPKHGCAPLMTFFLSRVFLPAAAVSGLPVPPLLCLPPVPSRWPR